MVKNIVNKSIIFIKRYNFKIIITVLSESKVTEIYLMSNDFYKEIINAVSNTSKESYTSDYFLS